MSLTVKKRFRLINLAILCTTCATLYCAPSFKTASSGFKDIWAREFMFKPVISLNDRRAHVETWLLSGYEHRTSMLCILLSDMLFTRFDDEYVFNAEIPRHYFFNRAEWLKGEKLSDSETQNVKALFERCAKKHPTSSCLNYAFLPNFLKKTVGTAQNMETVLSRIASSNGCLCDHAVSENPTSGQLFQLLSEGYTAILERKSVDNWNLLSKDDDNQMRPNTGYSYTGSPDTYDETSSGNPSAFYKTAPDIITNLPNFQKLDFPQPAVSGASNPYDIAMVDAFTILSYAAEAWGKPMGIVASVAGFTNGLNLRSSSLFYNSFHYSHSRQFRSNIVDEHAYWHEVLEKCGLIQQQQQ